MTNLWDITYLWISSIIYSFLLIYGLVWYLVLKYKKIFNWNYWTPFFVMSWISVVGIILKWLGAIATIEAGYFPFHWSDLGVICLAATLLLRTKHKWFPVVITIFMTIGIMLVVSMLVSPKQIYSLSSKSYVDIYGVISHFSMFFNVIWLILFRPIEINKKTLKVIMVMVVGFNIISVAGGVIFLQSYDFCLTYHTAMRINNYGEIIWWWIILYIALSLILFCVCFVGLWYTNKYYFKFPKMKIVKNNSE